MKISKLKILLVVFGVLGFLYRLCLIKVGPQEVLWDALEYSSLAQEYIHGHFGANCCNISGGYPMFIAVFYKLFGGDNFQAVRVGQAILEIITALLLYAAALRLFRNRNTSLVVFTLYIINPFTASYTGLLLTEALTFTAVAAIIWFLADSGFGRRKRHLFILGLFLGILVLIKVSLYFLAVVSGVIIALSCVRNYRRLIPLWVLFGLGFVLASAFSIYTNYTSYRKISIRPPYRVLGGALYTSFFKGKSGELANEPVAMHPEFEQFIKFYYIKYHYETDTLPGYDRMYMDKFKNKLRSDWPQFIRNWVRNALWTWDKYHLFTYEDPWYPRDKIPVRTVNILLLLLHGFGLMVYIKSTAFKNKPLLIFGGLLFLYISLTYPMINNETRLSLPYYPVMILWAGYGLSKIQNLPQRPRFGGQAKLEFKN
ncbi:hypothetical protein A2154_00085 [Candidatus Gottesmanbacteria bacterium RBG_16_43_7]|uniref:Glycosyltransferase RgtA/B/C/D-like domain-containing protein n=1 Tax=Candidatus Gottesmanbacteria bacterium RBG_16_43_7 TaxID=1798373 RepID=A0A1F5ZAG9_9BACT|nr:MAG: hypothetical protein A2154_00085 [Candidatus Gottesmanbacteria bacterium RBG_16_43_7]